MKLSGANKDRLEIKGLTVWDSDDRYLVSKKAGVGGNSIPGFREIPVVNVETGEETYPNTDCPSIQMLINENEYTLVCWYWVPGPGPGDFEITFTSEDKAVEFLLSYYFGENKYFEARRLYEAERDRA